MASVSLEGVSKVYQEGATALVGLDLQVQDHEFLVLLGPSGCGKSTTLRLIAGLEDPSDGEIRIGDRVVNRVAPKDRDIAMVFQNYALYPHMTVYRNMAFGLEMRYGGGWLERAWHRLTNPKEAARKAAFRERVPARVQQTSAVLGIEHLLGRMPRQLSGGERQRVALGRAMVRQPAVFLFDEPLSNLDAKLRLETRRELKQLHARLNATMIYVTHDQVEALTLGQRVAVLDRGELQQVGSPLEVYDAPSNMFVAGFIGSPPMNLVSGSLRDVNDRLCFQADGWMLPMEANRAASLADRALDATADRSVVLGFRAEDVRIEPPTAGPLRVAEASNEGRIPGTVTLTEAVGDATYVHVEIVGETGDAKNSLREIVCKEPPRAPWQHGDRVSVVVDPHRIHMFSAADGESLDGPRSARSSSADPAGSD